MTTKLASLNQTMCVDMAVGPDVENISKPSTLQQQTQPCHIADGEPCFGLPYEDHNYGAPLPIPQKFSVSSIPVLVAHGAKSEIDFEEPISPSNMCMKKSRTVAPPSEVPRVRQNGLLKNYSDSHKNSNHKKNNHIAEAKQIDVTRCICGFSHDDGYMICCDRCYVWQHIDCVNIDRNNIPDTYLCDSCNPRPLNKHEAMQLQAKKIQDFSQSVSELSSGAESGDDLSKITYTAVQSTPTSLTITSNRTSKRCDSNGKKRKRSKDDNKRLGKKTNILDRKRSHSISKGSLSDVPPPDERFGTFIWSRKLKEWTESYQTTDKNLYTNELLQAVLSSSSLSELLSDKNESVLTQLRNQLAKVRQLKNKVLAMEDICMARPVLEVVGSYMLSNQAEAKSGLYKRPYPYVFFYNGFDGLEVVVDSRMKGNIARFLRRSCCPNSEVRHVIEGNRLHLFVYSKDYISSGSEITIPFDFKYQNCVYDVECGCGNFKDCPVYKFTNMRIARNHNFGSKQSKAKGLESGRVSPLRLSMSRIHETVNGYPSSDHDSPSAADGEHATNQENQRKKSREDRKVEAYMRRFALLEKQEKRKEQLQMSLNDDKNHSKETSVSVTTVTQALKHQGATEESRSAAVQPAKRTNRRRSTRGNRRHSKKVRAPSFEGVLSPSPSVENDSNHSTDIVTNASESNTEQCAPISGIELNADSCSACDVSLLPEQGETNTTLQNINEAGEVTSQSSETQSSTDSTALPIDIDHTSRDCALSNAELKKDLLTNVDDLPQLVIENVSQDSVSKPTKKKAMNTTDTSVENSQDATVKSSTAQSLYNVPFTYWEYRPGVPNGQVHISVGRLPGRKRLSTDVHLKKNWLKTAKEEGFVVEAASTQHTDTRSCHPYKKRLLHSYFQTSKPPPSASSEESNDTPSSAHADSPKPLQNIIKTTPSRHSLDSNLSFNSTDVDSVPLNPSALSQISQTATYPTMVYESLSEDDDELSGDDELGHGDGDADSELRSSSPPPAKGVSNQKQLQDPLSHHSLKLNGDLNSLAMISGLDHEETQKQTQQAAAVEDNQASSKKKVTLQEYLKRSKEQRKNSVLDQNELKTTAPTRKEQRKNSVLDQNELKTTSANVSPSTSGLTTVPIASPVTTTSNHSASTSTAANTSSPLTSQTNSSASSVVASPTSNQAKETKPTDDEPKNNKEGLDEIEKLLSKIAKPTSIDINSLTDTFAPDNLPPKMLTAVKELLIKNMPLLQADSPKEKLSGKHKSSSVDSRSESTEQGCKSSTTAKESSGKLLSSVRPSMERSNSSPSVRHSRHGSTPTNNPSRKVSGSRQSSPSSHHSTPNSHNKTFASPASTASPRLMRGHSGSQLNSPSTTPTIYDRRRRSDAANKDSVGSGKSRHSSGASSVEGSQNTIKSPKSSSTADIVRHPSSKHSSNPSQEKRSSSSRSLDSPQKVSSLASSVHGQPIPSLARGPGTARVPQVVCNRRPSPPRLDAGSPPSWDMHPREPPPSRSLKDVCYSSRPDPYYYPRAPSPSRDKYSDRYPPSMSRSGRREDDHHLPYYSHPNYYPEYRSDRPALYYPPVREPRPPSPGPPPRSSSDYYHRHSGYYPHDYHR